MSYGSIEEWDVYEHPETRRLRSNALLGGGAIVMTTLISISLLVVFAGSVLHPTSGLTSNVSATSNDSQLVFSAEPRETAPEIAPAPATIQLELQTVCDAPPNCEQGYELLADGLHANGCPKFICANPPPVKDGCVFDDHNIDYPGNDLVAVLSLPSPGDCCEQCWRVKGCTAWVFSPASGDVPTICHLKSSDTNRQYLEGSHYVSGTLNLWASMDMGSTSAGCNNPLTSMSIPLVVASFVISLYMLI